VTSLRDRLRAVFGGSPPREPHPRTERVDCVAPWLYIGPALSPTGVESLGRRGVTHVIDLRAEGSDDPAVMERVGLRWRRVPIPDREAPSDEQIDSIVRWLDGEADSSGDQAVYLHCHAGVSRTPTVAIALLMHQDLTLAEARRLVFAARPEVAPTDRQMDWLQALERRLRGGARPAGR